jgi:hypothetical protein
VISALLWWSWRRRGPTPPAEYETAAPPALTEARIDAWIDAGESRLALEHLSWLVRDRADFADWRARADTVRFAPGGDVAVAALVREGWAQLGDRAP